MSTATPPPLAQNLRFVTIRQSLVLTHKSPVCPWTPLLTWSLPGAQPSPYRFSVSIIQPQTDPWTWCRIPAAPTPAPQLLTIILIGPKAGQTFANGNSKYFWVAEDNLCRSSPASSGLSELQVSVFRVTEHIHIPTAAGRGSNCMKWALCQVVSNRLIFFDVILYIYKHLFVANVWLPVSTRVNPPLSGCYSLHSGFKNKEAQAPKLFTKLPLRKGVWTSLGQK